jgi:GNAT superfamily N-acetyltransferase
MPTQEIPRDSWPAPRMRVGRRPPAAPDITPRKPPPPLRSVRNGLAAMVAIALVGSFFAWVTAEPLWLALGRGAGGTAVVSDCVGASIGQRCVGDFRAADGGFTTEGVRLLGEADRSALDALRLAAGPTAWEHSAVDPDRPPVFGRFAGGALVAAATLEDAGEPVSSVGVLTHPGHRGRGHGRAVAAAATRAALDAGSVAHYQTLDANAPSVAIARALGFGRDATTLAVRPG